MKKFVIPLFICLLAFVFAGCNRTPEVAPAEAQAETSTPDAVIQPVGTAQPDAVEDYFALRVDFEAGRSGPQDFVVLPIAALGLEAGRVYELSMRLHSPDEISILVRREITHPDGRSEWVHNREWQTVDFDEYVYWWAEISLPLDLSTNPDGNIQIRRPAGQAGAFSFYVTDVIASYGGEEVSRAGLANFVALDGASLTLVADPGFPDFVPPPGPKTEVQLRVGDLVFIVSGMRGTLDVAPVVIDGVPYLPLSFISEATGITEFPDELQTAEEYGHQMVSLYSLTSVLGIPGEWNSTTQFIRISVEIDRVSAVEVEPAQQPDAIRPLRTLEDQRVPIDFEDVKTRSDFDLSRALSGPHLYQTFEDFFSLGVSLNGINLTNVSIISHELAALTAYHFNSITYSNLMKPDFLLDHANSMANAQAGDETAVAVHFHNAIPGMEFAKANGLMMRGHTLLWHTQTPDWFFREGFEAGGELASREVMIARLESYISQVLDFFQTYYPGIIYAWDVVNEAVTTARGQYNNERGWHTRTHHGPSDNPISNRWYETVGPDYVRYAFTFARRYADPDVRLFYNDYNTFQRDKTMAIVNLLTYLQEHDLVDGMGMQSAFGLQWPGSLRTGENSVVQAIEAFSALGLELHMSEHTVRVGSPDFFERQAERYREFFEIVLEMHVNNGGPANITNVTFFGLMDNYLFYAGFEQYYWLFDYRLQPKPAFYAVMDSISILE
ncbi:MAG: endo-1,4-beta-xylanase [Defluviitaleaceae bacterium]|nr:endo-1,4-beta-xylanase [Defluviitaleaceae bacterium]